MDQPTEESRPWRILGAAVRGDVRARPLVQETLAVLEADETMGDYGRYRVREFRKLLGHE